MPWSSLFSIATSGPSSPRTSQTPDSTHSTLSCSPSGTVTWATAPNSSSDIHSAPRTSSASPAR